MRCCALSGRSRRFDLRRSSHTLTHPIGPSLKEIQHGERNQPPCAKMGFGSACWGRPPGLPGANREIFVRILPRHHGVVATNSTEVRVAIRTTVNSVCTPDTSRTTRS